MTLRFIFESLLEQLVFGWCKEFMMLFWWWTSLQLCRGLQSQIFRFKINCLDSQAKITSPCKTWWNNLEFVTQIWLCSTLQIPREVLHRHSTSIKQSDQLPNCEGLWQMFRDPCRGTK
jgi:hypothetical protein